MTLYKRGKLFWAYVSTDGVRHAKSTGTGTRKQAELIEQRFKEELNLQRHQLPRYQPDMLFQELAAEFLASGPKEWHKDRLKVLLPYFAETKIGQINKGLARRYQLYRHAERKLTTTTVNRDLECLRHILFWAVDEGYLAANPLSRMRLERERKKKRPVLGLEEEAQILFACSSHLESIVIIALDAGMRRGEILGQRWEDIDFARRLLYVTHSKTPEGESREIPLTERLFALLWESRQDAGLIFTFEGKPIKRIKTAWKAAIRRAGVRYITFHYLRHTFNTRLLEAGVLREVRMALMGHSTGSDPQSTYEHIELPLKREAIRKLEEWRKQQLQALEENTYERPDQNSRPE